MSSATFSNDFIQLVFSGHLPLGHLTLGHLSFGYLPFVQISRKILTFETFKKWREKISGTTHVI